MDITQTSTQRVVLVDGEAKRHVRTVTLVGIVGQVGIIRFKVVIEDTTTEAHAVNGKVWVSNGQFAVGLVVVFGTVNPHGITGT